MKIRWLEDAIQDLEALHAYVAHDNLTAANRVAKKLVESTNFLMEQPWMGRVGRVPNTRELIVSGLPYIIPYRVKNNVVEILRVFHSAMQWPEEFQLRAPERSLMPA